MYGAIQQRRTVTSIQEDKVANKHKNWWVVPVTAYLLGFVAIYLDLPIAVRFAISAFLLLIQFFSFRNASAILLLSLFLPFFSPLLGEGILRFNRLAIIPFLFLGIQKVSVRSFPANRQLLLLALIAIGTLKITADLQIIFQSSEDPTHPHYYREFKNYLADYYDFATVLLMLFFVYTKMTYQEIKVFFRTNLLVGTLLAASILFIGITNFEAVVNIDKGVLWDSPLFNHKQYWGPLMFMLFIVFFVNYIESSKKNIIDLIPLVLCLGAVLISMSRTAYVSLLLGIILYGVLSKNIIKLVYVFLIALLMVPVVFQLDFVKDRMKSMIAADNVSEFQSQSSGHFSDRAMNQYLENFTFAPQVFYTDWEYNYSEGFWNGVLHQSGIIGLILVLMVFYRLIRRYSYLQKFGNTPARQLAITGSIITVLSLIINVIVRHAFIINYYGIFTGLSITLMILYLTTEVHNLEANIEKR